jgi:urease accessory protein
MRDLLPALQLGDSLFPSGAFSHSSGLETLVADGVVMSAAHLAEVLDVHLRERLARSDLPALLAVHATDDPALVRKIDRALSAVKLASEERAASERMGLRLATECARLTPAPALEALIADVRGGRTPGNAAVAMGLATRALGLSREDAGLVLCYSASAALVSAALRLMRLGHGEAQAVLLAAHPAMRAAVTAALDVDWRDLGPCAPQLDVAAARHQRAATRLFAS